MSSALTCSSSPSSVPAVSPRPALQTAENLHHLQHHFLQRHQHPRSSSSAASPRSSFSPPSRPVAITSSPSQYRPSHARVPSDSPVSPRNTRAQPKPYEFEGRQRGGYVHAGTQYSPDGYPPTDHRRLAGQSSSSSVAASSTVQQQQQQQHTSGDAGKKRKGGSPSRSPSPDRMTTSKQAAASAAPVPVPDEPQPRLDPGPIKNEIPKDTRQLPERPAEPQEARSTHGHSSAPKKARGEPGQVKIMPRAYETCNPKDLGILISNMLMELIRLNDQIPLRDGRLTRFHSRAPPGISVYDYLQRLIQHATLSPPILLSMVYYIDRLCALYPAFTINSLTVHRFLITAATVAAKGLSDSFWTNPTYARIGGIPVGELATLEMEFLQKTQWKIVPKPETLEDYYASLVERTDGFQLEAQEDASSDGSSVLDDDAMVQDPT